MCTLQSVLSPCLGKKELVFVLIVHLFVSYTHFNLCHFFSSSWCRGLAAASACGSSWTFLLTFLPSENMFKELQWLPFPKRVQYHICIIMYKALNGQTPTYISSMFTRCLRSVDNDELHVPFPRTTYFWKFIYNNRRKPMEFPPSWLKVYYKHWFV